MSYELFKHMSDIHDVTLMSSEMDDIIGIMRQIPLTQKEWWDSAPWQDMNSLSPDNGTVLVKIDNRAYEGYKCFSGAIYINGAQERIDGAIPTAWLPLPEHWKSISARAEN